MPRLNGGMARNRQGRERREEIRERREEGKRDERIWSETKIGD